MLRQAEVELAKGLSILAVSKKLGITDQMYDSWWLVYGGMNVDQARRLPVELLPP